MHEVSKFLCITLTIILNTVGYLNNNTDAFEAHIADHFSSSALHDIVRLLKTRASGDLCLDIIITIPL